MKPFTGLPTPSQQALGCGVWLAWYLVARLGIRAVDLVFDWLWDRRELALLRDWGGVALGWQAYSHGQRFWEDLHGRMSIGVDLLSPLERT